MAAFGFKLTKKDMVEFLVDMAYITLGSFICAVGLNAITLNFGLLSGGTTGIAVLLHYVYDSNVALMVNVLNAPLFIFGLFKLGKRFMVKTILCTLIYSFFITVTSGWTLGVSDKMLAALFGGVLGGIGGGLVLRRNACMGGIGCIAVAISRRASFPVSSISTGINVVILAIGAQMHGIDKVLLTVVNMYVGSMASNFIVEGLNRKRVVFVVSGQWENIRNRVLKEMQRGTTVIKAEGGYTGEDKRMLYCVVNTIELAQLKNIINDEDPMSFHTIIEATEVAGRNFSKHLKGLPPEDVEGIFGGKDGTE